MSQILKHELNQCQVIKNDETKNFLSLQETNRAFLGECTDFVRNIINIDNSPWTTCDTTRWARRKGIRLNEAQGQLLRFLQHKYFRKGMPCFSKQSFIANRLNTDLRSFSRRLKALEDKGLIIRIQWIYKTRRMNCMVLPIIPSITKYFNEKCLPDADFQKCHHRYDVLFCKFKKSKEIQKSFIQYTNIIYVNKLFNINNIKDINLNSNNIVENYLVSETPDSSDLKIYSKCSEDDDETVSTLDSTEKPVGTPVESKIKLIENSSKIVDNNNLTLESEELSMLDRFLLKRKETASCSNVYQHIFDDLKHKHNYEIDRLDLKDCNDLLTYIEHFHSIDLRGHFKIPVNQSNRKKMFYSSLATEMRRRFIQLIIDGHEIKWTVAERFINAWNESAKLDKRISKINTNKRDSKSFINSCIVITHCLIYKCKGNISALMRIPERLKIARNFNKAPFTWRSKVSIDKMLTDNSELAKSRFIDSYIGSDLEFNHWLYETRLTKTHSERVNNAFPLFNEKYVDNFFPNRNEFGKELCYRFEGLIKKWLETRIIEIVDMNCKTYNYSLVFDRTDSTTGEILPSLIDLYFYHLKVTNRPVGFNLLFSNKFWKEFIAEHMQTKIGINDFYEIDRQRKGKA